MSERMIPSTTPRARAREMTDAERRDRHERSMRLYYRAIACSYTGMVLGLIGIAFWPASIVSVTLLVVSVRIARAADRVSPYGSKA